MGVEGFVNRRIRLEDDNASSIGGSNSSRTFIVYRNTQLRDLGMGMSEMVIYDLGREIN